MQLHSSLMSFFGCQFLKTTEPEIERLHIGRLTRSILYIGSTVPQLEIRVLSLSQSSFKSTSAALNGINFPFPCSLIVFSTYWSPASKVILDLEHRNSISLALLAELYFLTLNGSAAFSRVEKVEWHSPPPSFLRFLLINIRKKSVIIQQIC